MQKWKSRSRFWVAEYAAHCVLVYGTMLVGIMAVITYTVF